MASKNPGGHADLAELRQQITELVSRNAIAMVQCAIDGVMEEGQYQAIKYLFEMVGIYPAAVSGPEEQQDSLSKVLLKHLGVALPEEDHGEARESQVHPVE